MPTAGATRDRRASRQAALAEGVRPCGALEAGGGRRWATREVGGRRAVSLTWRPAEGLDGCTWRGGSGRGVGHERGVVECRVLCYRSTGSRHEE